MTQVEPTGFGDKDPEDAWDDGDDDDTKLAILERIVVDLSHRSDARHEFRRTDALRLLFKVSRDPARNARLTAVREALEAM